MSFLERFLTGLGFAGVLAGLGLAQPQPTITIDQLMNLPVATAAGAATRPQPVITIDQVMTGEELRTTGVAGLTPSQRSALDKWLSEYTLRVLQVAKSAGNLADAAPGTAAATYAGGSSGHWIRATADDGAIIVLEDGSMWGISSLDRIDTMLWLPISNITILRASPAVGDYRYSLITDVRIIQ